MGKSRHQSHPSEDNEFNSKRKRKHATFGSGVDVLNKSKARQQSKKHLKEFIYEEEDDEYFEEM